MADPGFSIFSLLILFVLLFVSALASGSEAAFFSIGPAEKEALKQQKSKSAQLVLQLLNNPKELLATLLITNNFVNIAIVILTSTFLDKILPFSADQSTYRFLIEVVGITFLILLIGEVIPKIWSSNNAISMAKAMAKPINTVRNIPPISWLKLFLVNGTNLIQRSAKRKGIKITTDELEQAIALTKEDSTSEEEHKILEGIVKFGNTDVAQIMQSRIQIIGIEKNTSFSEVLDTIIESGYSRIPVFEKNLDNIEGILYAKDLIPYLNAPNFNWNTKLRSALFIPENKKIDDLLKDFQNLKMHMALVVDEYGGTCGLVTLEDVLEEIVGDITDEFDDNEIAYTKINPFTFIFEGRTLLMDFYKIMNIDGKVIDNEKGEAESLGGLIVEKAGRIPMNNESIQIDNMRFIVESSDKKRVKMIKVIIKAN
jgi:gliding motility-associated protein GldE